MTDSPDRADRTLIACLQENARLGVDRLSELSGLSAATVHRRLKRLNETGVIEREIAVVNPDRLGRQMVFVGMVELERERLDQVDAFRRVARAEPQVQQCYYVTGEADFTLICTARDMADFEALTHRLFFENANVRKFRTSVVMDRVKVGLSVPVGEGD